jgi:hypothetical protein
MIERRRSPRYAISLVIEISSRGEQQVAHTMNLSLTGVRVVTKKPLSDGGEVTVLLYLFKGERDAMIGPVQAQGCVVWTKCVNEGIYEAGIDFQQIPDHQKEWLEDFLKDQGGSKEAEI